MMKYKLKCVALFSLLAAGVFGCKMEQEINLPEYEPKLTLRLALTNVDTLQEHSIQYRYSQLFIGRSQSVLYPDENLAGTDNATVKLYDENGDVVEAYTHTGKFRSEYGNGYSSEVPGYYAPTKNFVPEPDKSYTIRASAYGFKEITATATMPEQPTVADLSFKGEPYTPLSYNREGELMLTINNKTSRKNYYRFVVLPLDSAYNRIAYPANSIDEHNGADLENNEKPHLGKVFSDELYTSGKLTFSSRIAFSPMDYSSNQTDKKIYTRYLEVQVQQLSEEEYLLLKTREAQWQSEDNPFAESQNVYSNVRNGYGVLGGVSVSSFYVAVE